MGKILKPRLICAEKSGPCLRYRDKEGFSTWHWCATAPFVGYWENGKWIRWYEVEMEDGSWVEHKDIPREAWELAYREL